MKRVCVFCGSNAGHNPAFAAGAWEMGRTVAERGLGLVYGGGNVGLMGAVADGALAAGGEVIGVIPTSLKDKELAHPGATEMHVVASLAQRKQMMADLSWGFISLPGGLGTLDELFEMLTWNQLGVHSKPCGLLNAGGYYDGLLAFLRKATGEGFIRAAQGPLLLDDTHPAALLDKMEAWRPTPGLNWMEEAE